MEDTSIEELLAQVDALSIIHSTKDSKEYKEDTVLGIVWSDDEISITEDNEHDNNINANLLLTPQIVEKYLDQDDSSNNSDEKNDNIPLQLLSNQHITARRSFKQKPSFSCEYVGNNSKMEKMVTFDGDSDVMRKLSFKDDKQLVNKGEPIEESFTDEKKIHVELNNDFEQTEICLAKDIKSSNNFQNEDMSQDCFVGKTCDSKTFDILSNTAQQEKWNKAKPSKDYSEIRDNAESDEDVNTDKGKVSSTRPKLVVLSSGTDSDYDSVLGSENESNSEESQCEKHPVQLLNKGLCGVDSTHKIENKTGARQSNTMKDHISITSEVQLPKTKASVYDSNDDDFEEFLADIRTPKPHKTPISTPSLKNFIVDEWVVSSDEEEEVRSLPNKKIFNLNQKMFSPKKINTPKTTSSTKTALGDIRIRKPKNTPKSTPSLKGFIVNDCSDDEELPSLVNTNKQSLNLTEKTLSAKKFFTPKPKRTPLKKTTLENTPLKIASVNSIERIVTPYVNTPQKFWRRTRDHLVEELSCCYNETVFDNKLPADMSITWNKQMTKTAGFCYYVGPLVGKKCRIELSEKVVDSCERIRDTLIHELCHAATWLIDGIKAGHGPHWKRWALKARLVHSNLPPISRCHSYDINYKFNYRCVKCHHRFGRHSKSVNLETSRCPYCMSRLELLPRMNKDGTPAKPRAPSKFSLFVKNNYRIIKAEVPGSSHQEIMKELSKRFAEASLTKNKENTTNKTGYVDFEIS